MRLVQHKPILRSLEGRLWPHCMAVTPRVDASHTRGAGTYLSIAGFLIIIYESNHVKCSVPDARMQSNATDAMRQTVRRAPVTTTTHATHTRNKAANT